MTKLTSRTTGGKRLESLTNKHYFAIYPNSKNRLCILYVGAKREERGLLNCPLNWMTI